MGTQNRSRVSSGQREGGQYKSEIHTESELELDLYPPSLEADWVPADFSDETFGETSFSEPEDAPAPIEAAAVPAEAVASTSRSAAFAVVGGSDSHFTASGDVVFSGPDGEEHTMSGKDLFDIAQHRAAAVLSSRSLTAASNGVTRDDIAQETILAVLENVRAGKVVNNPEGYVRTIGRTVGVSMVHGDQRWEDRNGLSLLAERVDAYRAEYGTEPTRTEIDIMAEDVRDSMPLGSKPSVGFHIRRRSVSIDQTVEDGGSLGETVLSHEGFQHVDDLSHIEGDENGIRENDSELFQEIYDQLDQRNSGNRGVSAGAVMRARSLAWDAIASYRDIPRVASGSVDSKLSATSRRAFLGKKDKMPAPTNRAERAVRETAMAAEREKNIRQAISDWEHGEDTPLTDALFAPFGNLNEEQKDDVTDQFKSFIKRGQNIAYPMWDGAMKAATSRK